MLSLPSTLPAFASASLPPTKALACQTAIVGGGAGFSLYFPCANTRGKSFLVSLSSHKGYFQRPEGFYYPESLEALPLGFERLEAFEAFQAELLSFLFPYFQQVFPACSPLGSQRFLSGVIPPNQAYASRRTWLLLPDRKGAEA